VNLPRRVARILTNPRAEWQVIAGEHDDVGAICRGYISILALIPGVSVLAGIAMMGGRFLGVAGVTTAITAVFVSWFIALGSSIAVAVIIEKLAPAFNSEGDTAQALKLVAYSSTPIWLAGISYFFFVALGPIVVLAWAWAVYLFFAGAPIVMKTPRANVIPFVLVSILAVVIVNIVLRATFAVFRIPYY
jgi:hypothetical protein